MDKSFQIQAFCSALLELLNNFIMDAWFQQREIETHC